MCTRLNTIVAIACLSITFQLSLFPSGITAQSLPASQNPSRQSSSNNPSTSSSTTEARQRLALVPGTALDKASNKALDKTKSDAVAEASPGSAPAEPKVSVKNPKIEPKINLSESKMNERPFASPEIEILGEPMSFRATAYALKGRTRSGAYVRRGVIAADPRVIPLGSIVQIKTPGYTGVYTVHDTGKKIKGNIVDLWVPSSREARIFGRRSVKLHVLRFGLNGRRNK